MVRFDQETSLFHFHTLGRLLRKAVQYPDCHLNAEANLVHVTTLDDEHNELLTQFDYAGHIVEQHSVVILEDSLKYALETEQLFLHRIVSMQNFVEQLEELLQFECLVEIPKDQLAGACLGEQLV